MNTCNLEALRDHCERFRKAIEQSDKGLLPIGLQNFPRGACGDAALLLAKYLEQQGFGTFQYMLGMREGYSHAWLQGDRLIVDITADQFSDMSEPVIVSILSPWHEEFNGAAENAADFEIYDEHTRIVLGNAYARIVSNIRQK